MARKTCESSDVKEKHYHSNLQARERESWRVKVSAMAANCTCKRVKRAIERPGACGFMRVRTMLFLRRVTGPSCGLRAHDDGLEIHVSVPVSTRCLLAVAVQRVQRVVAGRVSEVAQLVQVFLFFPDIPMETLSERVEPVGDLVGCADAGHRVLRRGYPQAESNGGTFSQRRRDRSEQEQSLEDR